MDAARFYKTHDRDEIENVCRKAKIKFSYFKQVALGNGRFSAKAALRLAKASSGEMTKEELRPDVFESEAA